MPESDDSFIAGMLEAQAEQRAALLRAIGAVDEPERDEVGQPDFDGGVRETAPPTNPDAEADHNETAAGLIEMARQARYGA